MSTLFFVLNAKEETWIEMIVCVLSPFSYRQLQMTHRDQDDSIIRQVATGMEMEVCRKATSRVSE